MKLLNLFFLSFLTQVSSNIESCSLYPAVLTHAALHYLFYSCCTSINHFYQITLMRQHVISLILYTQSSLCSNKQTYLILRCFPELP